MLVESGSLLQLGGKRVATSFWNVHSVRFEMALLICCAMVVFSIMRGSLSMAMVCMIESSEGDDGKNCSNSDIYKVCWTAEEQGFVHTGFYVGAFIAVLITDPATRIYGAKNIMSLGLLLNAIGAFLTPLAVILFRKVIFVALIRTIVGFGFGFGIPCGSMIISKWFPIAEKSTAMAVFSTGNQIGIGIAMLLTCQIPFLGGWPASFCLYGILNIIFMFVWHFRAANKPRESKYITATELEHIMGRRARKRANTVVQPTPYRKAISSPCVIAICACSFAQSFVLVGLLTYLPRFNQMAMNMSVTVNGILSALPFFVQMITKLLFGTAADAIKAKRISATVVTKASNAIASFGTALCIVFVAMLGSGFSILSTLLIALAMGLFSGYVPGYNTSIVSVAPQFTAFVSSYSQMYAQVGSTVAPALFGFITENGTTAEFRIMFFTMSASLVFSGLAFQFMGHARAESWGEIPSRVNSLIQIGPDRPASQLNITEINARLEAEPKPSGSRTRRVSYRDSKREESQTHLSVVLEDDVAEESDSERQENSE